MKLENRDSNGIRTQNHLVRKRTLNYLPTLKRVREMIITCSQMHRTVSTPNTAQSFRPV